MEEEKNQKSCETCPFKDQCQRYQNKEPCGENKCDTCPYKDQCQKKKVIDEQNIKCETCPFKDVCERKQQGKECGLNQCETCPFKDNCPKKQAMDEKKISCETCPFKDTCPKKQAGEQCGLEQCNTCPFKDSCPKRKAQQEGGSCETCPFKDNCPRRQQGMQSGQSKCEKCPFKDNCPKKKSQGCGGCENCPFKGSCQKFQSMNQSQSQPNLNSQSFDQQQFYQMQYPMMQPQMGNVPFPQIVWIPTFAYNQPNFQLQNFNQLQQSIQAPFGQEFQGYPGQELQKFECCGRGCPGCPFKQQGVYQVPTQQNQSSGCAGCPNKGKGGCSGCPNKGKGGCPGCPNKGKGGCLGCPFKQQQQGKSPCDNCPNRGQCQKYQNKQQEKSPCENCPFKGQCQNYQNVQQGKSPCDNCPNKGQCQKYQNAQQQGKSPCDNCPNRGQCQKYQNAQQQGKSPCDNCPNRVQCQKYQSMKQENQMDIEKNEKPDKANEACPGIMSDQAGKMKGCEGCPYQKLCSSGQMKKQAMDEKSEIAKKLQYVKHKIIILSGKGGVGKSTVASQLALSLSNQDFEVGLMDLDLCGPSIPRMMNVENQEVHQSMSGWQPVSVNDNLRVMSIGFLLNEKDDAVIWRGPRKNGLIKQFLTQVDWADEETPLDYLIIDTPPGTSDEHISIIQLLQANAACDGAIIVTTPQEVALLDVRKEISFCKKSQTPIIGVVENMSGFICSQCNHETQIFPANTGGAAKMCEDEHLDLLGKIPLNPQILLNCEAGQLNNEESFAKITSKLIEKLNVENKQ